jgi:hypothetical protein
MTRHTPPSIKPALAITDLRLGSYKLYPDSVGDTWDPAWAADGSLVFPGNDGSGWDDACGNNVFFSRVVGDDPLHLSGTTLSCMSEYGGWAEKGPDGATWKSSGCISVDGVLYFGVARHTYGTHSGDPFRRQTAKRASLIKSSDGGQTWTRSAQENYDAPMFATGRFATPYFIHYDQDGAAPAVDNAEAYIYAISNNGFWCNGDNYVLGRVERAKLDRLDASDWTFYTGGDGMDDEAWSPDHDQAALIIDNPLKCGETGATYIPALDRYLLVAWSYPGDPNVETDETRLIFYEAPHPWGPWEAVREIVSRPEGWYCPRVLAKWQRAAGREVEAVIVTGGDYYEMSKYYRFTVVPLRIRAGGTYPPPPSPPETREISDDAVGMDLFEVEYRGAWRRDTTREKARGGSEHISAVEGDLLQIRFEGRRLTWHTSKENSFGVAAVSIDGGPESLVDLYTYCVEPQYGRFVYDSGELSPGEHLFTVRVTGQKAAKSSGHAISHDRVEITV